MKRIKISLKRNNIGLLYFIANFQEGTAVDIKTIRILDNKSAILYYVETLESKSNARSHKCG
jgi:hypothetical protein